jgi:GAF domain-containing protein
MLKSRGRPPTSRPMDDLDDLFDAYAVRLRAAVGSPVATITLLEPTRQRLLGAVGLGSPYAESRETPLSHSFCRYVVDDARPLVVADARTVPELAHSPAISELNVIAYAGWPISRPVAPAAGDVPGKLCTEILGAVCVIDHQPRQWSSGDLLALCDLAHACAADVARYVASGS